MSNPEPKQTIEAGTAEALKTEPTPRFADAAAKDAAAKDAAALEAKADAKPQPLKFSEKYGTFEVDDYDEGLDVNSLPGLPWTREALGEPLFTQIATVAGAGGGGHTFQRQRNPSLDPRSFGTGRAKRLIALYGLKPGSEQAKAYLQEGLALQEAINEQLPAVKGTPRNPTATPLKPTTTTTRERNKPANWA